jgi:hypothetical protein
LRISAEFGASALRRADIGEEARSDERPRALENNVIIIARQIGVGRPVERYAACRTVLFDSTFDRTDDDPVSDPDRR